MVCPLPAGDVDQCVPALQLLAMAARHSPDSMQGACEPYAVVLLSQYIGSSEFDLQVGDESGFQLHVGGLGWVLTWVHLGV